MVQSSSPGVCTESGGEILMEIKSVKLSDFALCADSYLPQWLGKVEEELGSGC